MPCPRSRCAKPVTFKTEDGVEMETWFSVRRSHIRRMRKLVKNVVLCMAVLEAIRVGPDTLVFAGSKGYPERGPEDFGIAYWVGYFLSWLYLCAFVTVWTPLFSWWVKLPSNEKSETGEDSKMDRVAALLHKVNMFILPAAAALNLIEYAIYAIMTLIYVDARPVDSFKLPKNSKKNWLARLMLVVGGFTSITLSNGMFEILASYDLAHIKSMEYYAIVLPVQINLGILLGSAMQWRMEKRLERKAAMVQAIESGTVDEKEGLLTA